MGVAPVVAPSPPPSEGRCSAHRSGVSGSVRPVGAADHDRARGGDRHRLRTRSGRSRSPASGQRWASAAGSRPAQRSMNVRRLAGIWRRSRPSVAALEMGHPGVGDQDGRTPARSSLARRHRSTSSMPLTNSGSKPSSVDDVGGPHREGRRGDRAEVAVLDAQRVLGGMPHQEVDREEPVRRGRPCPAVWIVSSGYCSSGCAPSTRSSSAAGDQRLEPAGPWLGVVVEEHHELAGAVGERRRCSRSRSSGSGAAAPAGPGSREEAAATRPTPASSREPLSRTITSTSSPWVCCRTVSTARLVIRASFHVGITITDTRPGTRCDAARRPRPT